MSTSQNEAASDALQPLIDAWARFGVKLERDTANYWQWAETGADDDPPGWIGIYSPPFSTFEACVKDVEASLGPLPDHLVPGAEPAAPQAATRKLKVLLQQYVEKVAEIEIEIPADLDHDEDAAVSYAKVQAMKQAQEMAGSNSIAWKDGDDAQDVDTYGVMNDAGEMLWER